jgi:hypothetical protein
VVLEGQICLGPLSFTDSDVTTSCCACICIQHHNCQVVYRQVQHSECKGSSLYPDSRFLPLQKRPELEARAADLERQSAAIVVPGQSSAQTYEKLRVDIAALEKLIMAEVLRPERCLHFMRPGRLVQVKQWPFF